MYNVDELKQRLNLLAKGKGVSMRRALQECGLNPNAVNQAKERSGLSSATLCALADYFECSVDYILGRGRYLNGIEAELLLDRINSGMPLRDLVAIYGSEIIADFAIFRDFAAEMAEEEKALTR